MVVWGVLEALVSKFAIVESSRETSMQTYGLRGIASQHLFECSVEFVREYE